MRLVIFVATTIPESVNSTLAVTVPSSMTGIWSTPAANASTAATTSAIADNEPVFARMYSIGRTGETARAYGICWLFSNANVSFCHLSDSICESFYKSGNKILMS